MGNYETVKDFIRNSPPIWLPRVGRKRPSYEEAFAALERLQGEKDALEKTLDLKDAQLVGIAALIGAEDGDGWQKVREMVAENTRLRARIEELVRTANTFKAERDRLRARIEDLAQKATARATRIRVLETRVEEAES